MSCILCNTAFHWPITQQCVCICQLSENNTSYADRIFIATPVVVLMFVIILVPTSFCADLRKMSGNQVHRYTPGTERPPIVADSGVGTTAESSQCTDINLGGECDVQSATSLVCNKVLLCTNVHFDADGKEKIMEYHQETCIHNAHDEATHTGTTPAESKDGFPIECSDKCHRGVLVLSRRFWQFSPQWVWFLRSSN